MRPVTWGKHMSERLPPDAVRVPELNRLWHDTKTITDLDALRALRHEWDALTAAVHDHSFCLTYSYCELAASVVLSAGGRVEVIRVYDVQGLCALWPVAIQRKGLVRIATALSCGTDEEYGGPLVRDGADAEVFTKVVRATTEFHADVLRVRFVTRDGMLHHALGSRPQSWLVPIVPKGLRDDVPGYSISLRECPRWEEFAATRPKLFVNLRRYFRRLNATGQVEIGWCKTAEDANAVVTWLFANKRRWAVGRQIHTQYLMNDQVRDFFVELAHRTDLSSTPLVAFVKLDGVPIAASVNLVGPTSFEGYFTTYDEAFADYSPGNLMHEFCMKWAHANGRDFDFRPIHSTYKARWANRETHHSTLTIFLTLRGRLAELGLLAGYGARVMGRLRASLPRWGRAS
jgi:CelD/BcsL family acetyltransferase involved in cellulose biosynthesis